MAPEVQNLAQIGAKTTNQVPGTEFDACRRQSLVAAAKHARPPRGPCRKWKNSAQKCAWATNQVPGTEYDV
jgi:hypothetical protein